MNDALPHLLTAPRFPPVPPVGCGASGSRGRRTGAARALSWSCGGVLMRAVVVGPPHLFRMGALARVLAAWGIWPPPSWRGGEVEGARPRAGGHAGCGRRTAMRLSSGPVDQLPRRPHAIRYPRGAVSASGVRPHVGLGGRSTAPSRLLWCAIAFPSRRRPCSVVRAVAKGDPGWHLLRPYSSPPVLQQLRVRAQSARLPPAVPVGAGAPPFPARRAGTPTGDVLPFRASAALGCSATGRLLFVPHVEAADAEWYSAPAARIRPPFSGIRPGS